jgi:hypothetical protein
MIRNVLAPAGVFLAAAGAVIGLAVLGNESAPEHGDPAGVSYLDITEPAEAATTAPDAPVPAAEPAQEATTAPAPAETTPEAADVPPVATQPQEQAEPPVVDCPPGYYPWHDGICYPLGGGPSMEYGTVEYRCAHQLQVEGCYPNQERGGP